MSEHNEIMVDLETWGRQPDGAIATIGATCFNLKDGITSEFYEIVDIADAVKRGGAMHPETMRWWLKQAKSARYELVANGIKLKAALEAFIVWYRQNKGTRIWARNVVFDIALLNYAFEKTDLQAPYTHREVRDTYVLDDLRWPKAIATRIELIRTAPVVWHNALQDAKSQTKELLIKLRYLDVLFRLFKNEQCTCFEPAYENDPTCSVHGG